MPKSGTQGRIVKNLPHKTVGDLIAGGPVKLLLYIGKMGNWRLAGPYQGARFAVAGVLAY